MSLEEALTGKSRPDPIYDYIVGLVIEFMESEEMPQSELMAHFVQFVSQRRKLKQETLAVIQKRIFWTKGVGGYGEFKKHDPMEAFADEIGSGGIAAYLL